MAAELAIFMILPGINADGSRSEPSGRGYFPGPFNGADVTVKDSKRYAATGGWGYYNFNHHEPKAPTAIVPDWKMPAPSAVSQSALIRSSTHYCARCEKRTKENTLPTRHGRLTSRVFTDAYDGALCKSANPPLE